MGKRGNVKGTRIRFGKPHKFEVVLLVLALIFFAWSDVLQNKFLDNSLEYKVTVFGDIQFTAINGFWIAIFIYHILLFILIITALFRNDRTQTGHVTDGIVGIIMTFSTSLVILGSIGGIYTSNIPFFSFNTSVINVYHIGVAGQILGGLFFAITS